MFDADVQGIHRPVAAHAAHLPTRERRSLIASLLISLSPSKYLVFLGEVKHKGIGLRPFDVEQLGIDAANNPGESYGGRRGERGLLAAPSAAHPGTPVLGRSRHSSRQQNQQREIQKTDHASILRRQLAPDLLIARGRPDAGLHAGELIIRARDVEGHAVFEYGPFAVLRRQRGVGHFVSLLQRLLPLQAVADGVAQHAQKSLRRVDGFAHRGASHCRAAPGTSTSAPSARTRSRVSIQSSIYASPQ